MSIITTIFINKNRKNAHISEYLEILSTLADDPSLGQAEETAAGVHDEGDW